MEFAKCEEFEYEKHESPTPARVGLFFDDYIGGRVFSKLVYFPNNILCGSISCVCDRLLSLHNSICRCGPVLFPVLPT